MSEFESPADRLSRENIPPGQLSLAGDGDPSRVPPEIVAIYGDASRMHYHGVVDLDFSPDGRFVASVGADHTIRVWDPQSGKLIKALRASKTGGESATFSADSSQLFVAVGARVVCWNTTTWHIDAKYMDTGDLKTSVQIDSNGRLFGGANDGLVRVWDFSSEQREVMQFPIGSGNISFAISPDEKLLAAGGSSGDVKIFSIADASLLATIRVVFPVAGLLFTKDGQTLVTSAGGNGVRCWNVADPAAPQETSHFDTFNSAIELSADSQRVFVSGFHVADPTLTEVDLATGQPLRAIGREAPSAVRAVKLSPDGKTLAPRRSHEFDSRMLRPAEKNLHPNKKITSIGWWDLMCHPTEAGLFQRHST